jgi:putative radical SAM enzyme (TIGR03279 family)
MKITGVDRSSPLFGQIRPGYRVAKINGRDVIDSLDCLYKLSGEDRLRLLFEDPKGERHKITLDNPGDLGLEFEPDTIKVCKNKCIFCFIHQQPKGMRRSLYVKDEDFRLSFTHGNFISMSNLSESDMRRIVRQRLSPLYVSVHTTDDRLRQFMFQNKKLKSVLPQLRRLTNHGITIHTQVVVCPSINDGEHLEKTIDDLYRLYPGVQTLGVVPVGLTKYREKLPKLESFDKSGATVILDFIHDKQASFMREKNTRFVFAADEFYILTGREFPRISEYETMEQFENGIGMMRLLLTDFNRRKQFLPSNRKKRILFLTGTAAYDTLENDILPILKEKKLMIDLLPIENNFWGGKITVTGLITGNDMLRRLKNTKKRYDLIVLPPNCLNNDDLFLDDMSLMEFCRAIDTDVMVGKYSLVETLNEAML